MGTNRTSEQDSRVKWRLHTSGTRLVRRLLGPEYSPCVRSLRTQYEISDTPYGRLALIKVRDADVFIVAAEDPPFDGQEVVGPLLGPEIRSYLEQQGLQPWRLERGASVEDAIFGLSAYWSNPDGEEGEGPEAPVAFSPYLCEMEKAPEILGANRQLTVRRLAALVAAQSPRASFALPVLVGDRGIGRHSMAAAAAEAIGRRAIEMPLRRLVAPRFLQTPEDSILSFLLKAQRALGPQELLVVSDAHLLGRRGSLAEAFEEALRLGGVVLLAREEPGSERIDLPRLVLPCHGLSAASARQLVRERFPKRRFAEGVLVTLMRLAASDGGVNPGRLLYLLSLTGDASPVYPDDIAMARFTAERVWGG